MSSPIHSVLAAARAVLAEALESIQVHPCDAHDDALRARMLDDNHRALYDALALCDEAYHSIPHAETVSYEPQMVVRYAFEKHAKRDGLSVKRRPYDDRRYEDGFSQAAWAAWQACAALSDMDRKSAERYQIVRSMSPKSIRIVDISTNTTLTDEHADQAIDALSARGC